MGSRLFAFVIWAAVAAGAVAWGLRLAVRPLPVPAHALPVAEGSAARADLSRLLGSEAPRERAVAAAPAEVSSRFRLIGVVAPRGPQTSAQGLALLAVDGKPARPYRVGREVDERLVLLSVHRRGASLGPREGPASVKLELPDLPPPATGTPDDAAAPAPAPQATPAAPAPPPRPSLPRSPVGTPTNSPGLALPPASR